MTEYDNRNTGLIAKNERKEKDTHPDITGTLNVDGTDYFIDGWQKKRNSDGKPFYSLRVKPKAERVQQIKERAASSKSSPIYDDDSEIPF